MAKACERGVPETLDGRELRRGGGACTYVPVP